MPLNKETKPNLISYSQLFPFNNNYNLLAHGFLEIAFVVNKYSTLFFSLLKVVAKVQLC